MSDKIRDYTGALPPPEPDKESEVDPAKFKKVLKVDESEESQKKHKRRLKKQEEEGEEEEVQGDKATPDASTAFGDFMTDQDEVEGLFDAQSSKGQVRESSADKPTPFKMVSDTELPPADHEDVQGQPAAMVGDLGEAPPSQTPRVEGEEEEAQPPPPPPTEEGEVYTPPPPPPEEPPPQYSQQPPEEIPPLPSYDQVTEQQQQPQPQQQQQQKDAPKQKKKEVDSSLLAGKTKRGALKKAKEEKAKAPIYVGKKAKAESEAEVAQVAPTEKKAPAKKAPSKEGQKVGVKLTPEQAAALGEQETPSERKKGEEEEQTPTFSIEGAVTTPEGIVTIEQPSETPTYTKLNPQVFELFERMVGVLTVQQNTGVTTTTLTLSMKNSVFDGAEITLDHYSTAPNSFNVRLQGSPEAIQLFNANIEDLMTAFQQTKSPYTVNILTPSLQKKYRMVKKKGEGDSGDTSQEQQK